MLAESNVISLLIDTPMVRPGFVSAKDMLASIQQASRLARQDIIDLRRGLDLLLARPDVDASRVAYVGHSFSAHVGAILAGIEPRIQNFVLMASAYSDEKNTMASTDPNIVEARKSVGDERLRAYFRDYAWDDPIHFLGHTEGHIFLQFASQDPTTPAEAQEYLSLLSVKDKRSKFYQAGHALNGEALLDRDRWLQQHLQLGQLDERALEKIPQLH